MMNMKPMNLNAVDETKLSFGEVKNLDNGGKIAFVNYGDEGSTDSLMTYTGLQDLPWDMNTYDNPDGSKSYSLTLSFRDRDSNPATKSFYEGCEKLDSAMLDMGVQNQMEWLKKKGKSKEQLAEDYYTPNVRWAKDKETGERDTQYPPRFQIKLVKKNNKWAFDAYDQNKQVIDLDETPLETLLVRGAKVKALIKLTTVWTGSKGFGCKWAIMQLKIHRSQKLTGYAFADDDEDDLDSVVDTPNTDVSLTTEDDAESGEEEYLEEEVEVKPSPVKKKRVVRKKAA
jgi:hypothetical protein